VAYAPTEFAHNSLNFKAVSLIVHHPKIKSSTIITSFHFGFHSFNEIIFLSHSLTFEQSTISNQGKSFQNLLIAQSSGKTIVFP
jgi:hypothetical protein